MSFYSLLSEPILNDIKCQYEIEKEIPHSENQCSWYVYSVIKHLKDNNWIIPQSKEDLMILHNNSLFLASTLRSKHKKVSWGESIFSKTIQEQFNLPVGSPYIVKLGNCEQNNYLIIDSMKEIINYKLNLPVYSLSELIKKIRECYNTKSYILINRFGQSFLIYPYDKSNYIIFDSHVKQLGLFNINSLVQYILNKSVNNLITFIVGYMNNYIYETNSFDDSNYTF